MTGDRLLHGKIFKFGVNTHYYTGKTAKIISWKRQEKELSAWRDKETLNTKGTFGNIFFFTEIHSTENIAWKQNGWFIPKQAPDAYLERTSCKCYLLNNMGKHIDYDAVRQQDVRHLGAIVIFIRQTTWGFDDGNSRTRRIYERSSSTWSWISIWYFSRAHTTQYSAIQFEYFQNSAYGTVK